MLRIRERSPKIADLILIYFKVGGIHVQFNIVDQETLIDTQLRPEEYRDLIVRVSGYRDYVNLAKSIKSNIIVQSQFEKI